MSSTRVRLLFPDGDKYWLYIDLRKLSTIQDLVDDINTKYLVVCDKLMLDDAQLFCKETVNILQPNDVIQVILKKSKKRVATSDNNVGISVELEESARISPPSKPKKKKKKYETEENPLDEMASNQLPADEPVKTKHKKSKSVATEVISKNGNEVQQAGIAVVEKMKVSKNGMRECSLDYKEDMPISKEAESLEVTNEEPHEDEPTKRKRRRRKRKSQNRTSEIVDDNVTKLAEAMPVYVPPPSKQRQHLRFDNENSDATTEPEIPALNGKTNGESYNKTKKLVTSILPYCEPVQVEKVQSYKVPAIQRSPLAASSPAAPQLNALLSLRGAVFTKSPQEKTAPQQYSSVPPPPSIIQSKVCPPSPQIQSPKKRVDLNPADFPLITGPPRVNDVIAFKVLELSENYNPEISDYMKGKILNIDPGGDITVELLEARAKRHARGKFELIENVEENEYEEEPEIEYEKEVTYNWNEMIEPRLIFP